MDDLDDLDYYDHFGYGSEAGEDNGDDCLTDDPLSVGSTDDDGTDGPRRERPDRSSEIEMLEIIIDAHGAVHDALELSYFDECKSPLHISLRNWIDDCCYAGHLPAAIAAFILSLRASRSVYDLSLIHI